MTIAKSTYYHQQRILRIRGVASVRGEVGFDPELGQTVSVIWSNPIDVRLSNKAFNKLARALVALPLAEALDVLGSDGVQTPSLNASTRSSPIVLFRRAGTAHPRCQVAS